jgi:hypothetical protein
MLRQHVAVKASGLRFFDDAREWPQSVGLSASDMIMLRYIGPVEWTAPINQSRIAIQTLAGRYGLPATRIESLSANSWSPYFVTLLRLAHGGSPCISRHGGSVGFGSCKNMMDPRTAIGSWINILFLWFIH